MRDDAGQGGGTDGGLPRLSGPALLVEDSMVIAIDTVDLMQETGLGPVHAAPTARDAMAYLDATTPVVALLDVALGGGTSEPVARRLVEMGVPFGLTTGYGVDGEPVEGFPDVPVLRKPFGGAELQAFLRRVAGGR